MNGAGLLNLGAVDFTTLSAAGLQKLPYSATPIPGNNDATNKLVNGDVFAFALRPVTLPRRWSWPTATT